jgi:hypothetical protein
MVIWFHNNLVCVENKHIGSFYFQAALLISLLILSLNLSRSSDRIFYLLEFMTRAFRRILKHLAKNLLSLPGYSYG